MQKVREVAEQRRQVYDVVEVNAVNLVLDDQMVHECVLTAHVLVAQHAAELRHVFLLQALQNLLARLHQVGVHVSANGKSVRFGTIFKYPIKLQQRRKKKKREREKNKDNREEVLLVDSHTKSRESTSLLKC